MSDSDEERMLDQVFALAARPEQYTAFMESLESNFGLLATKRREPSDVRALSKHLDRAADLLDVVTPWRNGQNDAVTQVLSKQVQATLVLDATGQIVGANDVARATYNLPQAGTYRSLPLDDAQGAALLRAVQNTVREDASIGAVENPTARVHRFRNADTGRPMLATLDPLSDSTPGTRYAVLRTSDVGWPAQLSPFLQDLFELTHAETEVLRLVVTGERVSDIAAQRGTSIPTVRSQLASIYRKTDTANQMECMRVIFGLTTLRSQEAERLAADVPATDTTRLFPRDEHRRLFKLPGGRQIDYAVFGKPDGRPLLFFHCQTWGDVWLGQSVQAAAEAGFQIITPLRPGYGRTTVYDGEHSDPRIFAREQEQLLEHLEVERAPILCMGAGLVNALAAAERNPARVRSITAAHPNLPVLSEADVEGYNGFGRQVALTGLHAHDALRFLIKAGFAYVTTEGPEAFARELMKDAPMDIEWVTRPEILPITVQGLKTHAQGYIGHYGDSAYRKDWRDLIANCPVPLRLVIGEHDRNVQWRSAQDFAAAHEHVSFHELSDGGYLVHHQRFDQILEWIRHDP